jgi:hypothetical protein
MSDVAERLTKTLRRAEDEAGTLPAKEAVKLRPVDWHAVTKEAREAAAEITDLRDKLVSATERAQRAEAEIEGLAALCKGYNAQLASAIKERDEARAYLKAFVAATVDPEDRRLDVQLHQANPTLGWVFTLNDTGMRGQREILGSQIRRAMEIVGFDKLKIEPAQTTVADDHVKAVKAATENMDRALAAEAERDALRKALAEIASQKTVEELCSEFGDDYEGDWQDGYAHCVAAARRALTHEQNNER